MLTGVGTRPARTTAYIRADDMVVDAEMIITTFFHSLNEATDIPRFATDFELRKDNAKSACQPYLLVAQPESTCVYCPTLLAWSEVGCGGMTVKLAPGKVKNMQRLADERGVIAAAAMDQRGSLKKALGAARGGGDVSNRDMEEFKSLVAEVLTPHASAILLDPEYGLPASKRRSENAGLLLAYEESGYDNTQPGRLPDLLPHESALRLKNSGANAVKVLIYYTPLETQEINDIKHAFIERIGDECLANDIPFFLEFVGYDPGRW